MSEPTDILLIEDEPNIAVALQFLLGRQGWAVALHGQGAGAIEAIAAHRPRLVVLDLMLPGMSGAEILTRMRADAALADTPVLMLTARGQARDAAPGADDYLSKPFDNEALCAAVQRLIAP